MDRIVYLLFALSGIAGLVYEGTWARYLKIFLGHSSYGQILTLCIYMGGLGIGSFLAARLLKGIKRPLRAYALTEIAIGVGGFLYHPVYVHMTDWFYDSSWSSQMSSQGANAVKIALSVATTVPVAILLGMTFPFIAAGLMRRHLDSGRVSVPLLYFTNSFGAAVGLLFASYLLIPVLGTQGTLCMAAVLNLLLGVAFWNISKKLEGDHDQGHAKTLASRDEATVVMSRDPRSGDDNTGKTGDDRAGDDDLGHAGYRHLLIEQQNPSPRAFLLLALATGLTSFIYEVVWIRLLSLMMGSSTHSFDQMVSAFILGLALGSLVSRRLLRKDALVVLGLAQVLMGFFALSTIYSHQVFFGLMNGSNLFFRDSNVGYVGWSAFKYLLAVFWMVPTSFFAGMTLPCLTFIISRATHSEAPVGKVYGYNTFGAILGSVVGGLFLIPMLQLKWSLAVSAIADMAIGVALLAFYRPAWRRSPIFWGLLVLATFPVFFVDFDSQMVTAGVFRGHKTYLRYEKVWVSSGKTATISFHESPIHLYVKTNGKPDASIRKDRSKPIGGDEITQAATAFMSMATRNEPYEAGMVGFGSGMAAKYLLCDPLLQRLDIVEIEGEMLHLAQRFRPYNARAFDDPRSHLYVDDARTFFHTHGHKYDLLLSIPSNPWVSGVSSLFSAEFYTHIRRYLKPGGTLVQWMQLYEFDNTLMLYILKALEQSFPYVAIYRIPEEPDIVILASDQPIRQKYMDRFATTDSIKADLDGIHRPWWYFGEQNFMATSKGLAPLLDSAKPNSEFAPWVDNRAEMTRWAVDDVGLASAYDSCDLCWPAYLDPQDYAPRKAVRDWLHASRESDPYMEQNVLRQLLNQDSPTPLTVATDPSADQGDALWKGIWTDMRQLIMHTPFSPARDSLPVFALMRKLVDDQKVPLDISLQFEFNDHLAHGRYQAAARMLPTLREVFVLGTMDGIFLRDMAICAFLANDTRTFRSIFRESILPSVNMDNAEKLMIARLLHEDTAGMPLDNVPVED